MYWILEIHKVSFYKYKRKIYKKKNTWAKNTEFRLLKYHFIIINENFLKEKKCGHKIPNCIF